MSLYDFKNTSVCVCAAGAVNKNTHQRSAVNSKKRSSSSSRLDQTRAAHTRVERNDLGGKIVRLLQLKQLDRRYDSTAIRPR